MLVQEDTLLIQEADDGLSDKDFTADGLYLHKFESYPLKYSNSGEGVKIVHDAIVATPHLKWELT